jgi:hypothetical protein
MMSILGIPPLRLSLPSSPTWQSEEEEQQWEDMREAAKEEPLVTDPPVVDMSASVQMGYLYSGDSNLEIGAGFGLHIRPDFDLELNYNLTLQGLNALDTNSDLALGLRQDLGITIINTASEKAKMNIGIRLAFTYIRDLYRGKEDDLLGLTTGLEFGNYTPRLFLEYTWLNDLQGTDFHQAAMGLRVPFKI